MANFYLNYEFAIWKLTRSPLQAIAGLYVRAFQLWSFYLLPLFTLPLLMAATILPHGFSWRRFSPETRFLLIAVGVGLAGYSLEVYMSPTYPSPGTCLLLALVIAAMRYLRSWKWHEKAVGLTLVRLIPVIALTLVLLCAGWGPTLQSWVRRPDIWYYSDAMEGYKVMSDRARILEKLEREPGYHLVIVRYSPTHSPHLEWVYNGADIDTSKVVWARDMGREKNAELLKYFQGRRIWLAEPDFSPPRMSPYPAD